MPRNKESKYINELSLGNHEAYDYLFLKYYPKVNYFIQHLVKSSEVSKDLAQDIFEKIWKNRESLCEIESFNSYVFRMAKNSALNYLSHLAVNSEYLRCYDSSDNKLWIEEDIDVRDLEFLIKLVVEKMPPQRQRVYKMSREEQLKNREIAEILNISEKTVKNHLTIALKEIKGVILLYIIIFFYFN